MTLLTLIFCAGCLAWAGPLLPGIVREALQNVTEEGQVSGEAARPSSVARKAQ
jgi:hypothetical protein